MSVLPLVWYQLTIYPKEVHMDMVAKLRKCSLFYRKKVVVQFYLFFHSLSNTTYIQRVMSEGRRHRLNQQHFPLLLPNQTLHLIPGYSQSHSTSFSLATNQIGAPRPSFNCTPGHIAHLSLSHTPALGSAGGKTPLPELVGLFSPGPEPLPGGLSSPHLELQASGSSLPDPEAPSLLASGLPLPALEPAAGGIP